jgi:hypothetical protein
MWNLFIIIEIEDEQIRENRDRGGKRKDKYERIEIEAARGRITRSATRLSSPEHFIATLV